MFNFVPLDVSDILLIVNLVAGLLGVPVMQYIKNTFGVEGKSAFMVTLGLSMLLSVLAYFANSNFPPFAVTAEQPHLADFRMFNRTDLPGTGGD